MPRSESGYRFLDHTADILMEAWAPDEAGLLAIAAAGVVNAMTEGASVGDADSVTLEAEGLDPEDRLVTWLNEIIALAVCVTASCIFPLTSCCAGRLNSPPRFGARAVALTTSAPS